MRNAEFAIASSEALQQKCGGTMPDLLVRLTMGEMGEEFALASRRMQPAKLLAAGYQFRFPELKQAVRHEWQKSGLAPQPA
jgi:NAD dependent epimerase/dehydratase family enzyme